MSNKKFLASFLALASTSIDLNTYQDLQDSISYKGTKVIRKSLMTNKQSKNRAKSKRAKQSRKKNRSK